MGGCVVPPGTAAMCQTGGEEERGRGRERAEERETERCRRNRKKRESKKKEGGAETLPVCPSAVRQNNIQDPLEGIVCPSVQLWQSTDSQYIVTNGY